MNPTGLGNSVVGIMVYSVCECVCVCVCECVSVCVCVCVCEPNWSGKLCGRYHGLQCV